MEIPTTLFFTKRINNGDLGLRIGLSGSKLRYASFCENHRHQETHKHTHKLAHPENPQKPDEFTCQTQKIRFLDTCAMVWRIHTGNLHEMLSPIQWNRSRDPPLPLPPQQKKKKKQRQEEIQK